MREYRPVTTQEVGAYVCDRCQRTSQSDNFEFHEFLSFEAVGGYESIFGDGSRIAIDLCQRCLRETLGPWLRVKSVDDLQRERPDEMDVS